MHFEVKGLVLRETPVRDNDRYLDILTAEMGRLSVYARGVRSIKSKNTASTMVLTYAVFTLDRQREDFIVLVESEKLEYFNDSRLGLEINSLCMYICDVLREVTLPNEEQDDVLRLALNSLHALTNRLYSPELIKSAFELRLMSEVGYMPDLTECEGCGNASAEGGYQLDIMNGVLLCPKCAETRLEMPPDDGRALILAPLSATAVDAMRYIVRAPLRRLFAFRCEDTVLSEMSAACERYLLNQMERSFLTLSFYKQVKHLPKPEEKQD